MKHGTEYAAIPGYRRPARIAVRRPQPARVRGAAAFLICALFGAACAVAEISGNGLGACVWRPINPPPELWLYFRGGKGQGPFGNVYNYQPIIVGKFQLPEAAGEPGVKLAAGDAVCETYLLSAAPDRTQALLDQDSDVAAEVTVNRISPAMLIEMRNAYMLRLFGGDKSRRLTRNGSLCSWGIGHVQQPKDKMNEEFIAAYPYPWPIKLGEQCAPRRFAAFDGEKLVSGVLEAEAPLALSCAANGWLLLWYGDDSWFAVGKSVMTTIVGSDEIQLAPGDVPMLLTFSHDPEIELVAPEGKGAEGSVIFGFQEPDAKMTLMPLFGYYTPPAAETRAWSEKGGPPRDIAAQCDKWAARLKQFPKTVSENGLYDERSDTVIIRQETAFVELREGGVPHAPVPPMLELARRCGFPAVLDAPVGDTGMASYCGPYSVVDGAARLEIRVSGLGKHLWETRAAPAPGGNPQAGYEETRKRLQSEVGKMIAAGHMAPVNLPYKIAYGWGAFYNTTVRHLYCFPGATLRALARALPFLDEDIRRKTVEYMRRERNEFPPEITAHLPSDAGARRETWQLPESFIREDTNKMRDRNFHVQNGIAPAECLYDLAMYYAATGMDKDAIEDEGFDLDTAFRKTLAPWIERTDWATLGPREWKLKDPKYYGNYGWNMSCDINRQMAALIGLARLARMTGDKALELTAAVNAAKTFAHRLAVARYGAWLHEQGRFLLMPEGADFDFDMREVVLTEKTALLDTCRNQEGPLPFFNDVEGPFTCMTPEAAVFFRDRMAKEAERFSRLTSLFYPDAFMTLGSPRRCAEWWHNYPEDSLQAFLVEAWIMNRDGDWLRRHLDVPLVPVGDTFYMEKLAATLGAYSGFGREQP